MKAHLLPLIYAVLVCTAQHFGIPVAVAERVLSVVIPHQEASQ